MKTHLPKGLRAALMAALASVSITTAYGADPIVITGGTFDNPVVAGIADAAGADRSIEGGTYLEIYGGTFKSRIVGGSATTTGTATINGGAHLLINDGTFNSYIYGGNFVVSSAVIGSDNVNVLNGGVDITVNGGNFIGYAGGSYNMGIYAAGSRCKVSGDINLTINGDNVKFDTTDGRYYTISAGANLPVDTSGVTSSIVTLHNLTDASDLAKSTQIKVMGMGGQQGSTLNMGGVKGTINAQLSQFSIMRVIWESDLTLRQATNEALGDVSSVVIAGASILNLQNDAGQTWDLSNINVTGGALGVGTLKKTGAGKLTISKFTSEFGGIINVVDGELTLNGATTAQTLTVAGGATLSVKEGDLFTGTDAGSTISVNGATLAANEGNWTLNKAATIDGVTITGTHAVGLGSEEDNAAVVSLSGNINATNGNLILKNTAIAADKTATLSGNITFEGAVDNKGTLSLANGTTINVDEQSLIRNGRFIDGADTSASDKNGFFADTEVCLSTGGAYSYDKAQLTLTLDGVEDSRLELLKDSEKNQLLIGGLDLANTYFVREGEVKYSHIADVADTLKREVKEIAVGTNGEGDTHQLTLNKTLAEGVKVVSASDHAKVLLSDDVVLNASQTAIKGEANELHVTFDKAETAHGTGYVLMDDASKLSTLAGDATMKVDTTKVTSFDTEAKMTGKLEVVERGDLTVTDEGTIASFSSVDLGSGATLKNEVVIDDSIKSLSGSGTLEKTGAGKLAIHEASSDFSGNVKVEAGTLEVQNDMNAKKLSGSGKLVKTGEDTTLTVQDASGFTGDISVSDKALVNLLVVGEGVKVSLHELVIDNGTLGVYVGDTPGAGEDDTNVGALTLTGGSRIVVGGNGGKLEANLATLSGSILDFTSGGVLTMGCDLTVGEGTIVLLNESDYATLAEGGSVTLFSGVDNKAMEASKVSIYLNTVESADKMLAQVSFSSENGTVSVSVPEPATATLSLLALAGLAARRRRSKAVAA